MSDEEFQDDEVFTSLNKIKIKTNLFIFRGWASLETPGSVRPSVHLWELACEDDIYSASPARIRAFLKYT